MFLSPDTVLRKGLQLVGIDSNKQARVKKETNVKLFRAFFGSSPLDLAQMWMHRIIRLEEQVKNDKAH